VTLSISHQEKRRPTRSRNSPSSQFSLRGESTPKERYDLDMTAIRAIFNGQAFVPQPPLSLPVDSEALVLVDGNDRATQQQLDQAVRTYYRGGVDADDEAWGSATARQSHRAWDED
jgi:hypothetical protein